MNKKSSKFKDGSRKGGGGKMSIESLWAKIKEELETITKQYKELKSYMEEMDLFIREVVNKTIMIIQDMHEAIELLERKATDIEKSLSGGMALNRALPEVSRSHHEEVKKVPPPPIQQQALQQPIQQQVYQSTKQGAGVEIRHQQTQQTTVQQQPIQGSQTGGEMGVQPTRQPSQQPSAATTGKTEPSIVRPVPSTPPMAQSRVVEERKPIGVAQDPRRELIQQLKNLFKQRESRG